MKKLSGFTLIELLVVIAIIAILAAILFPVFAQVREKARQSQCISNEKQIALAVLQYNQDYDEMYPQSVAANGVQWYNMVQPYIKNGELYQGLAYGRGGVFHCPDFPDLYGQGQQYAAMDGLFVYNGGGTSRAPWGLSAVDAPADKIMIAECGRNGASPNPWGYETFLTLQGWWATSVMTGGVYDQSKDNSAISVQDHYNRDLVQPDTSWEGARTVRYRHTDGTDVAFCDGHVKAMHKGSIKWYQNVYIPQVYERNVADQYGWAPSAPF